MKNFPCNSDCGHDDKNYSNKRILIYFINDVHFGISSFTFAATCATSLSPRPERFTMMSASFGIFGARCFTSPVSTIQPPPPRVWKCQRRSLVAGVKGFIHTVTREVRLAINFDGLGGKIEDPDFGNAGVPVGGQVFFAVPIQRRV